MSAPQWHTYEAENSESTGGWQTNMFFIVASFGSILRHWKDEWRNRWFKIFECYKSGKWISIGHCLRLSCFMSFQVVLMTNVWLWFWMWATCCFSLLNLSFSHCIICPSIHLSFFVLSYAQFLPFFIWNLSNVCLSFSFSQWDFPPFWKMTGTGINLKATISDSKRFSLKGFAVVHLHLPFLRFPSWKTPGEKHMLYFGCTSPAWDAKMSMRD